MTFERCVLQTLDRIEGKCRVGNYLHDQPFRCSIGRSKCFATDQLVSRLLSKAVQGLEISNYRMMVPKRLAASLTWSVPSISALSESRVRRVSKRVFQKESKSVDGKPFRYVDNTHIRVNTTNGNGEHTIEFRVRQNDKSDQVTH